MESFDLNGRKCRRINGRVYVTIHSSASVDLLTDDHLYLYPLYTLTPIDGIISTFYVEFQGFLVYDDSAGIQILDAGPFVRFDRSPTPLEYIPLALVDAWVFTRFVPSGGVDHEIASVDVRNPAINRGFVQRTFRRPLGSDLPTLGSVVGPEWEIYHPENDSWEPFYDFN